MAPKKRKTVSLEPGASNYSKPVDETIEYDCRTCVKIEKIRYVWKINHLRFFHDRQNKMIESPGFTSKTNKQVVWKLRLNTRSGTNKNNVGLYLFLDSCDKHEGVVGKFKFAFLNASGDEKVTRSVEHKFTEETSDWGWMEFTSRTNLFSETFNLLPNDELTVTCDLEFASPETVEHATKDNFNFIDVPECNITQDLGHLLKNKCFCDVTLSVDGKEFSVHKAILAARSPVFAAMFRHGMKESSSNRVEIVDIDKKIFDELLRYIYTGKVNNLKDVVYDLLVAANKYDLERLKNICEAHLCKELEVENVIETLILADIHNLKGLKKRAIDFIKTCLLNLTNTNKWKNMVSSHPNLISEICCAMAKNEKMIVK